jgi:hypothetical protein
MLYTTVRFYLTELFTAVITPKLRWRSGSISNVSKTPSQWPFASYLLSELASLNLNKGSSYGSHVAPWVIEGDTA